MREAHPDPRDLDAAAALEQRFSRWWVWVSDSGAWWAARRTLVSAAQHHRGVVPHLQADTHDDLRDLLTDQDTRDTP